MNNHDKFLLNAEETKELPEYQGVKTKIEDSLDFKTSTVRIQRLLQADKNISVTREEVADALMMVIESLTRKKIQEDKKNQQVERLRQAINSIKKEKAEKSGENASLLDKLTLAINSIRTEEAQEAQEAQEAGENRSLMDKLVGETRCGLSWYFGE